MTSRPGWPWGRADIPHATRADPGFLMRCVGDDGIQIFWRAMRPVNFFPVCAFLVILWSIFLLDAVVFHGILSQTFAIQPRDVGSLPGMFFAWLFHDSLLQIISNTPSLFLLSLLLTGVRTVGLWIMLTVLVGIISGLGAWLFGGGHTTHAMACGLVFGYMGYFFGNSLLEKKCGATLSVSILLALQSLLIFHFFSPYASASWEGLVFGLVSGIIAVCIERACRQEFHDAADTAESTITGSWAEERWSQAGADVERRPFLPEAEAAE